MKIFQKFYNPLYKIFNKTKRIFLFLYLIIYNFISRKKIIVPDSDAVVTLTSHSDRILRAFATIESIGLGAVRPRKIILYLGNEYADKSLPRSLERLKNRGLEIEFCMDVGPHTKYFPYIQSRSTFNCPLVTADDDKIYEKEWLEKLIGAWKNEPTWFTVSELEKLFLKTELSQHIKTGHCVQIQMLLLQISLLESVE